MNTPEDLRYSKEREWVRFDESAGTAEIGVTDFAQGELGDIVFVELEGEGSAFDRDEVFGTVEAVKTVSELFMPVSGEIIAINEDLDGSPESVNEDAFGKGWMVRIKVTDPSQLDDLMSAAEYAELVG